MHLIPSAVDAFWWCAIFFGSNTHSFIVAKWIFRLDLVGCTSALCFRVVDGFGRALLTFLYKPLPQFTNAMLCDMCFFSACMEKQPARLTLGIVCQRRRHGTSAKTQFVGGTRWNYYIKRILNSHGPQMHPTPLSSHSCPPLVVAACRCEPDDVEWRGHGRVEHLGGA